MYPQAWLQQKLPPPRSQRLSSHDGRKRLALQDLEAEHCEIGADPTSQHLRDGFVTQAEQ